MDKKKIDQWVSIRQPTSESETKEQASLFIEKHGEYLVSQIIVGDISFAENLYHAISLKDEHNSSNSALLKAFNEIEEMAKEYGYFCISSLGFCMYEHVSKLNKRQVYSLPKEDRDRALQMRKELGFNDSNYTSLIIFSIISALVVLYIEYERLLKC